VHVEYAADGAGLSEQTRHEVVAVLTDLASWTMWDAGWARVAEAMESLAAAVAVGDELAVRAATVALELLSPIRVGKIGPSKKPPPKRVLTPAAYLVHTLRADKREVDQIASSPQEQKETRGGR
jgi:hypothetical protein